MSSNGIVKDLQSYLVPLSMMGLGSFYSYSFACAGVPGEGLFESLFPGELRAFDFFLNFPQGPSPDH